MIQRAAVAPQLRHATKGRAARVLHQREFVPQPETRIAVVADEDLPVERGVDELGAEVVGGGQGDLWRPGSRSNTFWIRLGSLLTNVLLREQTCSLNGTFIKFGL